MCESALAPNNLKPIKAIESRTGCYLRPIKHEENIASKAEIYLSLEKASKSKFQIFSDFSLKLNLANHGSISIFIHGVQRCMAFYWLFLSTM